MGRPSEPRGLRRLTPPELFCRGYPRRRFPPSFFNPRHLYISQPSGLPSGRLPKVESLSRGSPPSAALFCACRTDLSWLRGIDETKDPAPLTVTAPGLCCNGP